MVTEKEVGPEPIKPNVQKHKSRWLVPILAIAVAAAIIAATLFVYYSPDYSWDASIRDHDGDGHADNEDVFPDDATEWEDSDGDGVGDNGDPLQNGPLDGEYFFTFLAAVIWNGFGAVCTASEAPISWEDVTVVLSNGALNASWSTIKSADFSGYPYEIADCGELPLGVWEVTLLAWDCGQPNQALDAGDYLSFLFGEPLPKDVEYSVTVVYEPTGEVLAEFSYTEPS